MTVQAQESIEYRNGQYALYGAPLYQFLEQKPHVKLLGDTTAHIRGYQGSWILKDNKLFLKDLKWSNQSMEEIFHTNSPVLADWYTGTLEFGFGTHTQNHWWGTYENYLWFKVECGIVTTKKIVKRFYYEPEFDFGKYKSKKFMEVIQGKIYRNTYTTIKNFLEDLLTLMISNDFNFKVIAPIFKIEEEDVELLKQIRNSNIQYFLTPNYIAVSSQVFWEKPIPDIKAEKFSILLQKILSSDFTKTVPLGKRGSDVTEISENSNLINPDLNYLTWALNTVETFSVPPSFLKESFKIKNLKTLKVNRINSSIFEYEPIIEELNYFFPRDILELNKKRFEEKHRVIYNEDFDFYTHNIDESEMLKMFGYYIDELYEDYDKSNFNYDNNESEDTYDDFNDTYAQEYENLSDQFINDVLDGDPDMYWNID